MSVRRYLLTFGVVVLIGLGMTVGGVYMLVQRATGPRVQATVTRCEPYSRYGGGGCVGMWTRGGSLAKGGTLVSGSIDGTSSGDEGKTLTVTVSGNRAYTLSLKTPILLLVMGIGMTGVFTVVLPLAMRRSSASPGPTAGDAPRPVAEVAQQIRALRREGRLADAAALADDLGSYGVEDEDDLDTSLGAAVVAAHAEQISVTDPGAARAAYRRAAGMQRGFAAGASSGGEGSARMSVAHDMDARADGVQ